MAVEISYCVVNTNGRELLMRCLDVLGQERTTLPFETEILVLDNGSDDESAAAVAARAQEGVVLIAEPQRLGKAQRDSELLARAQGRYALLLNEDSELLPGASAALYAALESDPAAACAGATLLRPDGAGQPCAWRFPTVVTALCAALLLHKRYVVQSTGSKTRVVDWAQSSAMLVRRAAAAEVDWLDYAFFVYSDEVDFQKRLRDAGWHSLYVPSAQAIHHEQLSTGAVPQRRIVELSRNRDRYMRKHHGAAAARVVRWLSAWTYALRALAALVIPGHDASRYWFHATSTLRPAHGDGLREAAQERNRASEEAAT